MGFSLARPGLLAGLNALTGSIGPSGTNLSDHVVMIKTKYKKKFWQQNVFKNIICKISAILYKNQLFIFKEHLTFSTHFNSFVPPRSGRDFKNAIFSLVLLIGIFRSSHDNALRWMPHDLTNHKSTLVQVMAWCCQATSHYLSQGWLISMVSPGQKELIWSKWWCMTISEHSRSLLLALSAHRPWYWIQYTTRT